MAETMVTDYLIVGAGAMGVAFADTLVSDSEKIIAMVDRYDQPGGHWNVAYPYVRLHQPSRSYGVNSRRFDGGDRVDSHGWNRGLIELASGAEVLAYFVSVMHKTLIPSGRVTYFPKHEYTGEGSFKSLLTGKIYQVGKDTKIVDATYLHTPNMWPPAYEFTSDVEVIAPRDLPIITHPYNHYTVVGAGKTGVDACLWLMGNGIRPEQITLIISRDAWYYDRQKLQPLASLRGGTSDVALKNQCITEATSPDDLLRRLGDCGLLLRLSPDHQPTDYQCATVSQLEFSALKQVGTFVRKGRVQRITSDTVFCQRGTYTPEPDTLYIDCSTTSWTIRPAVPVFAGQHITLQPIRRCQQVFSAALLAHIEATYDDETVKNALSTPVPHPESANDYHRQEVQNNRNEFIWSQYPKTKAWVAATRLNIYAPLKPKLPDGASENEKKDFMMMMGAGLIAATAKVEQLMKIVDDEEEGL